MAKEKRTSREDRKGILAGGNWIIDRVKLIDVYPQPEQLATILGESQGTGGGPYNVLINLARAPVRFPLAGAGLVGADALGQEILEDCERHRIDARLLRTTPKASTSYTDVMTVRGTGQRTFFQNRGANALWTGQDLKFSQTGARIFYLGYLLLLDALDAGDSQYGTRAARLLASAQRAGLKTAIDVVSEEGDRFPKVLVPAVKHTDYCIINEIEAGKTTGIQVRKDDGRLDTKALSQAGAKLIDYGVREVVAIHFAEGGYVRTKGGEEVWQPSLKVASDFIKGGAGAGDAFCAGVLMGLHEGWELRQTLKAAVCMAVASMSHPTCTGGVKSLKSAQNLTRKFPYLPSLP